MNSCEITALPKLDYATAEAMNTLCTNLNFSGSEMRRIMITSSRANEGKSFISMNVARKMAEFGKKVAFIDMDLRKSVINNRYGIRFSSDENLGVVHFLAGLNNLSDVVYSTNFRNMYMIPVGRLVSNPMTLLTSTRLQSLMESLLKIMDVIIVDAPPVGLVIDAAEIAKFCDGVLFAVKYNTIRRRELVDAKEQIERTGCKILGCVLNEVSFNSYSSKKYYYKNYYDHYSSSYYQSSSQSEVLVRTRRSDSGSRKSMGSESSGK